MSTSYARIAAAAPQLVEHAWVVREGSRRHGTDGPGPGDRCAEVLLPDGRGLVQLVGDPDAAATRTDVLTGVTEQDGDGVRGVSTRAAVRQPSGSTVRLGLQLHPLALARLGMRDLLVDRAAPLEVLVDPQVVSRARELLVAGHDEDAVHVLVDALVGRAARHSASAPDALRACADVLVEIDRVRGLVSAAELARTFEVTISDLHRWCATLVGVPPTTYLAAVRFTGFVRAALGPGPASPTDVVAALRWYASAGYAPREVERFTGLTPVDLRRVERRTALLAGLPAA